MTNAALAQSVERLTRNEKVDGPIPSSGSLFYLNNDCPGNNCSNQ